MKHGITQAEPVERAGNAATRWTRRHFTRGLTLSTVATLVLLAMGRGGAQAQSDTPQRAPAPGAARKAQKALIVVTNHDKLGETGRKTGYYLSEVAHPYYALRRAGIEVSFASPRGGAAPLDPSSLNLKDEENRRFFEDDGLMRQLTRTLPVASLRAADYDAILFAGGHGTMWDLPGSEPLARLASQIYERQGVVAAVCHGPAGLVNVRLSNGRYLVAGKRVAAFTDEEERAVKLDGVVPFLLASRLQERGATHTKAANFQPHVEVFERLVTGQNPASARGVGEAVVRLLTTRAAQSQTVGTVTVVARVQARPNTQEEFRRACIAARDATRREAGCVSYDLHQGVDDPTRFVMVERFRSRADFDFHLQTPHVKTWFETTSPLAVAPVDVTVLQIVD